MTQRTFVQRIGMADTNGDISFNKLVTSVFVLQCAAIVAVWSVVVVYALLNDRSTLAIASQIFPPWSFLSFEGLVIGAGFGLKGFIAAKSGLTMTGNALTNAQANVTMDVTAIAKAVLARRADGIESSGTVPETHHD